MGEKPKKKSKVKKQKKKHAEGKKEEQSVETMPPDWAQVTRYNARFTWTSME